LNGFGTCTGAVFFLVSGMPSLDPEGPEKPEEENPDELPPYKLPSQWALRRSIERQYQAYENRGWYVRFRAWAASPAGASVVFGSAFVLVLGLFFLIRFWVEVETEKEKKELARLAELRESRQKDYNPLLQQAGDTQETLSEAEIIRRAHQSGNYQAALDQINQLEPGKQSSEMELIKAISYAQLNDRDNAEAAFGQAVAKMDNNGPAYFQWGQYLRSLGEYDAASRKFRTAMELEPENTYYRAAWGFARVQSGSIFSLLEQAKWEMRLDPPDPAWLLITAAAYIEVGNLEQSLVFMEMARSRLEFNEFLFFLNDPIFKRQETLSPLREYYLEHWYGIFALPDQLEFSWKNVFGRYLGE